MIKHSLIIGLLLIISNASFAQNFEDDIAKMVSIYENATSFHIKVKVRIFESTVSETVSQKYGIEVMKKGNSILYDTDDATVCLNDSYSIVIKKSAMSMVVSKPDNDEYKDEDLVLGGLDTLFKKRDSRIIFSGIKNAVKIYKVSSTNSTIKNAEFHLDSETGLLKKIIYHYDTELYPLMGRVEIDYEINKPNVVFDSNVFNTKNFFVKKGKTFSPVGKWTGYSFSILSHD